MRIAIILLSLLTTYQLLPAQGTKERIKVYSEALEGNLVNDPAERDVSIYLPPSYNDNTDTRYPVLYMLHGFTDSEEQWFGWAEHWINLPEILDQAIAEGQSKEMIVVMPNAYNRFKGSMYSSSATIGDWETFISQELVSYIDANYRTLASAESRGLAGHSMGGYGTIRLGMKNPEVWSSIYLLSPCCMDDMEFPLSADFMKSIEAIDTDEELEAANFFAIATLATAAAWAPNPNKPPYYLDLPFAEGEPVRTAAAKIASNKILNIVDQYIHNLQELTAIGMDAGNMDFSISGATKQLHQVLEAYQIPHVYESYDGDHLNRIGERIQTKTLPFFSEHLKFE